MMMNVPLYFPFPLSVTHRKSALLPFGSSPGRLAEWLYEEENDPREKIAYVRECSIHDEYYEQSMEKISGFLKVIGINKCIDDQVFQKQLVN